MTKVTDIEQLKSLNINDNVYIFKNGEDKMYTFLCNHPNKNYNCVILLKDEISFVNETIFISSSDIIENKIGDIYVGKYDTEKYIKCLIEHLECVFKNKINFLKEIIE
jgi:hypothetical protein